MVTPLKWILMRTGRWHGWYVGGQESVCNLVNAIDLEKHPAAAIEAELLPVNRAAVCLICAKKVGLAPLAAAQGVAGAWLGYIKRHLERCGVRGNKQDLQALAAMLAQIGPPDDRDAKEVFEHVRVLMLTPRNVNTMRGRVSTLSSLRESLGRLQAVPDALRKVSEALAVWRRITGRTNGLDKFKSVQVIEVMLQIPDVEAYVTHMKSKGFEHLSAVFHPNVLERAKKDAGLRGTFSGSKEYWQATQNQLNIVED